LELQRYYRNSLIVCAVKRHREKVGRKSDTRTSFSEQYSPTWGQVHLDRRTIDLTKTKNGSTRTVHLNADALTALKTLHKKTTKPSVMVFPRQGPRFDTRSWFVPSLENPKISGYVWHSNRHTVCFWLAMAGTSIKEIQELAGHKTITMSARYSHLSAEHRISVIDRISSPQQG
jgi:integrase